MRNFIVEFFLSIWWKFVFRCHVCGNWPQLPGRHICQPCSLRATRFGTRSLMAAKIRGK